MYIVFTLIQRPLNGTLTEIETFLAANPTEVVTIFFEDYVNTTNALTTAFQAAGLTKYLFPLAKMPKDGSDWPTLSTMIADNQRLLVFTSDKNKEASEGFAYQWNYVVENQCELACCPFLMKTFLVIEILYHERTIIISKRYSRTSSKSC